MNSFARELTIAQIRTRRALGLAKPRRRLPRQLPPSGIQLEYYKALKAAVLAPAWEMIEREVLPALPQILPARADSLRQDAKINDLIDKISDRFFSGLNLGGLEDLARRFGERTSDHQREQLQRQTKAALGVDIFVGELGREVKLGDFVSENVALIKSLPNSMFDDIEKRVAAAVREGRRAEDLEQELRERLGVAEGRAKVIARDQIGKLTSDLNEARQKNLGAEAYFWRTLNDNRVREKHQRREGKRFLWSEPPPGGHPGKEILCRCFAEPDFSALLEEEPPKAKKPRAPRKPKAPKAPPKPKPPPGPEAPPKLLRDHKDFEAWAKKNWPKVDWDFAGVAPELLSEIAENFYARGKDFPEVMQRLEYVGTYKTRAPKGFKNHKWKETTYAHADRQGRFMGLNPKWFNDPEGLRKSLAHNIKIGWNPAGTNSAAATVDHEFGHLVDFWIREELSNKTFTGSFEGDGFGFTAEILDAWKAQKKATTELSRYAMENEMEGFAEAFSSLRHSPRGAQVGAFPAEVKRLIDWMRKHKDLLAQATSASASEEFSIQFQDLAEREAEKEKVRKLLRQFEEELDIDLKPAWTGRKKPRKK